MAISRDYYDLVVAREGETDVELTARRIALKIGKLRPLVPGEELLDVGCATGGITAAFNRFGLEATGVEVIPQFVDAARNTYPDTAFLTGAAEQLPVPDASFDFVTLTEVLEHVIDWRQTLREAARVLRSGGVLYISTTNRLWPIQHEIHYFPAFGYLPSFAQRQVYALAKRYRPELIGHTNLPALHWFTWRQLAHELRSIGLEPYNWLELMSEDDLPRRYHRHRRVIIAVVRRLNGLRAVLPPATTVVARKVTTQ